MVRQTPANREDASSMVTAGLKLTPRRGTVAHLGNQGCCVHIHTGNLSLLCRKRVSTSGVSCLGQIELNCRSSYPILTHHKQVNPIVNPRVNPRGWVVKKRSRARAVMARQTPVV